MSERQVSIAVDAIGGEKSPFKTLKGSEFFHETNPSTKLIFFGNKKIIEDSIIKNKIQLSNYEIVNSSEDVTDNDTPSIILRNRKQSSIYKGLEFVKSHTDSGFVSAGNTAAIMILSRLLIGMIEGIDRPAICSLIPNRKNFSLMLDLGANVNVNASNLLQFALMGYSYFSIIDSKRNPKIGIINIGPNRIKMLGLHGLNQDAWKRFSDEGYQHYYVEEAGYKHKQLAGILARPEFSDQHFTLKVYCEQLEPAI